MADADFGALLTRAFAGDQAAWRALVHGLSALILAIARSYRLGDADASDVCQRTWLALAQLPSGLRDPARLPAWLATTARRQALRVLKNRDREVPTGGGETADAVPSPQPSPELSVLSSERDRVLWQAVDHLPPQHRRLIRLLATRPSLTHAELAAELGIPPGSVGPLRRRALDRLRRALTVQGYDHA
ncbi:sigma-70 family RNA polymerase sigma factor [Amycolatopsis cynarae]|uniref:Sigma-70 family RNA polymerase sigma factor n=1 Tax=Amycolatopsis cynarae TaxID=2995223 RepID=A0ABY7B1I3_9PSEU|nr:sigma-70 family RNA polymerase sigma factor [Amycolatopsis sp. HUAS 11-8]WAL65304.1 sigma-70 family RNA polymerase sigma factor [Amycolatopsis sp. HUAS 11-8]